MLLKDRRLNLQFGRLSDYIVHYRIPQEIVDRCAAMNAKSEIIQSLVDSMNNLAEIISDVEHSLVECKSLIQVKKRWSLSILQK